MDWDDPCFVIELVDHHSPLSKREISPVSSIQLYQKLTAEAFGLLLRFLFEKRPGAVYCTLPFGQYWGKGVPDVEHVVPNF